MIKNQLIINSIFKYEKFNNIKNILKKYKTTEELKGIKLGDNLYQSYINRYNMYMKKFIKTNEHFYGKNRRISPFTQNILFDITLMSGMYPGKPVFSLPDSSSGVKQFQELMMNGDSSQLQGGKKHNISKNNKNFFSKKRSKTTHRVTRRLRRMNKHSTRYRK